MARVEKEQEGAGSTMLLLGDRRFYSVTRRQLKQQPMNSHMPLH